MRCRERRPGISHSLQQFLVVRVQIGGNSGSLLLQPPSISTATHLGLLRLHPQAAAWDLRQLVVAWLTRVAAEAGGPLDAHAAAYAPARARLIADAAARFREADWLGRR